MNADEIKSFDTYILSKIKDVYDAQLRNAQSDPGGNVRIVDLNLTTARDVADETSGSDGSVYKIGFPWSSVYVLEASENAKIKMRVDTKAEFQGDITLSSKDCLKFPEPVSKAFIHYAAQSGKTMKLLFLVRGEITPGNFVVTVTQSNEGSSCLSGNVVPVLATATQILPVDLNRKCATAQLLTGSTAPVWIGSSIVDVDSGAQPGIEIAPGGIVTWKNTAALYAIAAAAGTSSFAILEEA